MSEQRRPLGGEAEPMWSAYIHQKGNRLGLPVSGTFELTPRCNFHCKMCYIHQERPDLRELAAEEWLAIAREAKEAGMVFLLLTGGEPLLRPEFPRLLHELKQMGLLISVNTNGSLLQGELLEFLRKDPPLRLNVTLYGGSDETYERLCGRPMFHQVIANLKAARKAGLSIRLNASITPYNCGDIAKIYEVARELNLQVKATAYMFPPVRLSGGRAGSAQHRLDARDAAHCQLLCREPSMTRDALRRAAAQGGLPPEREDCTGGEGEAVRCRAGRSSFWMTWDGRMIPCGMMTSPGVSVLEKGFAAAWRSAREEIERIRLPQECTGCPLRQQCAVCAASCFAETGRFSGKPEYVCTMTKTLCKLTWEKYGKEVEGDGN